MFREVSHSDNSGTIVARPAACACTLRLTRIALIGVVALLATACQSDPPPSLASRAAGVPIGDPPHPRVEQVDRLVEACYDPFTFAIP